MTMIMNLIGTGQTDVGQKRDFNEDSFDLDLGAGLLVLADGMGGHAAGEVASRIATETVVEFVRAGAAEPESRAASSVGDRGPSPANRLQAAIRLANERIFKTIEEHPEMRGMGTTLVVALCRGDGACIAHIGDSRAYLFRDGRLTRLTDDHSWVSEQVRLGNLSHAEAVRHPFRNVITRALGSSSDAVADVKEIDLRRGDRLLLCSDGLTTMLDDDEIGDILEGCGGDPETAAGRLIERANEAGGEDNITVIVAGPA
jgi:serine/threonine protein phosphatase PrpC